MIELDRVELLFDGDFGANRVNLFGRYLLLPIAQEQSLDIIQFTGETLCRRRAARCDFAASEGWNAAMVAATIAVTMLNTFAAPDRGLQPPPNRRAQRAQLRPTRAARLLAARKPILSRGTPRAGRTVRVAV